jgi:hypothetical protein
VLTLRSERGADSVRSLRHVLKRLLRQYGMRCIDLRKQQAEHSGQQGDSNDERENEFASNQQQ